MGQVQSGFRALLLKGSAQGASQMTGHAGTHGRPVGGRSPSLSSWGSLVAPVCPASGTERGTGSPQEVLSAAAQPGQGEEQGAGRDAANRPGQGPGWRGLSAVVPGVASAPGHREPRGLSSWGVTIRSIF